MYLLSLLLWLISCAPAAVLSADPLLFYSASYDLAPRTPHLGFDSAAFALAQRDGESCDNCKRCKRNRIQKPGDCTQCIPCAPKTKPDPLHKTCIPMKENEMKDDKEDRFKNTKDKMRQRFKSEKWKNWQKKLDKMKSNFKTKQDNDRRNKQKETNRKRAGWCWAILAENAAWTAEDAADVTQDEVDGLTELWPDGVTEPVEAQIPEWNYKSYGVKGIMAESESAGFGAIISAIAKIFKAATTSTAKAFQDLKSFKAGKPTEKAVAAAKNSKFVDKVLKDKRFQDCIAATAGTAAIAGAAAVAQKNAKFQTSDGETQYYFIIDFTRKKEDTSPAPKGVNDGKQIRLYFSSIEDGHKNENTAQNRYTHDDYGWWDDRLQYERCEAIKSWYTSTDNSITAVGVSNGCCAFYDGENCQSDTFLFAMTDREDGHLKGKYNDAISSVWCTYDKDCKGKP